MRILGLISSLTDPASRARIMEYGHYFQEKGHSIIPQFFSTLKDANPPPWAYHMKRMTGINEWRSYDFIKTIQRAPLLFSQSGIDLIWQNRLIQIKHFFWETKLRKPVVFDFDDAIWLNEGEKEVIKKIKQSSLIFAGNDYLANFALKYNKNTVVIPTTVDTNRLFPVKKETTPFTIGWIGTKSNFEYLEIVKPAVLGFLSKNPDARLVIVSSEKPVQFHFDDKQVIFKPWTAETENELINGFSVGLMPLADTEWTRGKCGYKMLQYMACGLPVIVSPVGVNNQILAAGDIGFAPLDEKDWVQALSDLKNNPVDAKQKGRNARQLIEKGYSCALMTPRILEYFKTLLH